MLKQYLSLVFFLLFGSYIIGVHSEELKHITSELEVNAPASKVWQLYRNLGVSELAAQRLPFVQSLEVLRGDGGIGTVLEITFNPGNSSYSEEFIVIDDQKRVKMTQVLEGDCLAIGCSVEILRFDIIEKSQDSSIIRTDISYAVKKEFEANDPKPNIQSAALAQVAKEYLENKTLKHITSELEVHAPASQVWELYRNLGISQLAAQKLEFVQSLEVVRGDGGLGTVLKITFVPGNSSYSEEFTVIDDQKRVKETRVLEGDCLAIGCSVEVLRFDIIEKSQYSTIIRTDISYAVKKEFEANDPKPNVQSAALAQVAKEYLENKIMAKIPCQTSNSYQLQDPSSYIIAVHSNELKHIISELEVDAPASQVWELYRNLGISQLAAQELEFVQSLEVLRGDGGLGTVLKITFVPGNSSYSEEFIVIDDQKRVKMTRVLEGDCLAIGCSVEVLRFDIIEKSKDSSIIRTDISYNVKKEFEANDPRPNIQSAALAQVTKDYLESKIMARIPCQTSHSY